MQDQSLSSTDLQPDIAIAGITHPTVLSYFATMNAADYDATVALFAEDGIMRAPFEDGLVGRTAILDYLHSEAQGMQLQPREGIWELAESEDGQPRRQALVTGKVQTPIFGVNVQWTFWLSDSDEIDWVRIKLLASPRELLGLQQSTEAADSE
jgi:hypothetical protein